MSIDCVVGWVVFTPNFIIAPEAFRKHEKLAGRNEPDYLFLRGIKSSLMNPSYRAITIMVATLYNEVDLQEVL